MTTQKIYEAGDKMIDLIRDNYNVLQALGSFGISLGFGDKTVEEVCGDNNVDCRTFLTVINYMINGYYSQDDLPFLDVRTILHYLSASHKYYLDFQLPFMRDELEKSLDPGGKVEKLIMKFYDAYASEIRRHMKYEEDNLFPYIENLLDGKTANDYNIEVYSRHHEDADKKLKELKNIIIKYLPSNSLKNNMLTATLYDLYNNEEWLTLHTNVENHILVPLIRNLEEKAAKASEISGKASKSDGSDEENTLSPREKEVVVCLVNGLSNKEIASRLNISVNTVITHRKNIAQKLSIHSTAGLTIYAILKGLVDIDSYSF